jgi:hypothetical protein
VQLFLSEAGAQKNVGVPQHCETLNQQLLDELQEKITEIYTDIIRHNLHKETFV